MRSEGVGKEKQGSEDDGSRLGVVEMLTMMM
jgi:hypothetical protein